MTMPTFFGRGNLVHGTGNVSPDYPASIAADDFALLFGETTNAETVGSVTGYDSVLALDNTTGATRLSILSNVLAGNETAPTITDPGNHVAACIGVFRGVDPDHPIHAVAFSSFPGTSAAPAFPGLTTTIDDCLIVLAMAWGADNVGPVSSGFSNASLANTAERLDEGTTDGGGGGLVFHTGEKATAGQVDISTFTYALAASAFPMAIIALRPKRDQTITGMVTLDGSSVDNASDVIKIFDLTAQDYVVTASVASGAFTAQVRYDDHDYVAVYDNGTVRGSSAVGIASVAHDIEIFTESIGLDIEAPGDPYLTVAAIRDRVVTLIEALSPRVLASDRFVESRQEYAGDIRKWALANPQACFRRLSVRNIAEDETPLVSQQDVEQRRMVLEIVISYPQTHRAGEQGALDRDDAIESDFFQIDYAVGIIGRANFASGSAHDCTPMPSEKEIERDEGGVDFLVIRQPYLYYAER